MNSLEIAREYFPGKSDDYLNWVIWEETGFPSFWKIPRDGKTPEECFRKQLRDFSLKFYDTTRMNQGRGKERR